jgi:hypothetical protein
MGMVSMAARNTLVTKINPCLSVLRRRQFYNSQAIT